MAKFTVGDRVAVYDGGARFVGTIYDLLSNGDVCVRLDTDGTWIRYLPQQLRRIKPRRKPREWWICQDEHGNVLMLGAKTLHEKPTFDVGDHPRWTWFKVKEVLNKAK